MNGQSELPYKTQLDLLDVALFVRAAALSNLAAAGREFGLSAAVASTRLAQFERQLGARLLHRTTPRISVTQEGEIFTERARALLDATDAARASVGRAFEQPQGRLRVTMPSSLGRQHVSLVIPEFLRRYPGVSLDLRLTDQIVDLVDKGIDLAVRIGALKDSTLVARKLASNRRVLCTSPAYLAEHGTPRHPADLARHECTVLSSQRDWAFVTPAGTIDVRVSGRLDTDNGEVIRDMLLAGMAIGLKSTWSAAPFLHSGELVTVLDSYPPAETVAIWAVYPGRALVPPENDGVHRFPDGAFRRSALLGCRSAESDAIAVIP
ncbi:MAG: Transcriptional regulator Bxe_A2326, LysR family [uncultured Caballeronia sp.]|nr:MAG: Transcriptional regulator Bxe_A2326, LysR family [uncultured Caballeronia sp.]